MSSHVADLAADLADADCCEGDFDGRVGGVVGVERHDSFRESGILSVDDLDLGCSFWNFEERGKTKKKR